MARTKSATGVVVEPDSDTKVIKHEGDKWVLYSHDGSKKLGEYDTEEAAKKREAQIQFFKRNGGKDIEPEDLVEVEIEVKALKPGFEETENQIRYRVRSPGQFQQDSFRVMAAPGVEGVQFVLAKKSGEDTTTIQAVHFDSAKWSLERAKKWIADHPDLKELPAASAFKVLKQGDGRMRFFGVVSNAYRDRDTPPEILSQAAHKNFIARCDAGTQSFPILCLWHEKGLKLGQVDTMDFLDEEGLLVATGLIDDDAEETAMRLEELPEELLPLGMSHEFEATSRDRDANVVLDYNMTEASVLPQKWAANEWTTFTLAEKEKAMSFSAGKRDFLAGLLGEDRVKEYEDSLKDLADVPIGAGIERKDVSAAGEDGDSLSLSPVVDVLRDVPEVIAVEGADGSIQLARLVEDEPEEEPDLKERLEASESQVRQVGELILQLATTVKELRDEQAKVPTMVKDAVGEFLANLPRAVKYRATQEPENIVRKAKDAVEDASDGPIDHEKLAQTWDGMTRAAFRNPTRTINVR